MSRIIIWFFLLGAIIFLPTACGPIPSKQVNLTSADKGSQVEVGVGGQITITLIGNPSTGYSWEPKNINPAMFEQVGGPVFKSSNPGLVGSEGTLTLSFQALKAGTAPLTLVYLRPWETGKAPIDTFEVTVTVK